MRQSPAKLEDGSFKGLLDLPLFEQPIPLPLNRVYANRNLRGVCVRASRILSTSAQPQSKVLEVQPSHCPDFGDHFLRTQYMSCDAKK